MLVRLLECLCATRAQTVGVVSMTQRAAFKLLACGLAFCLWSSNQANSQAPEVLIAVPPEEVLTAEDESDIKANITSEWMRLQIRLKSIEPDQKPDNLTTSVQVLVGMRVGDSMKRVLVVRPGQAPVIIGIAPQEMPGKTRELVLLNLSAWVAHGRQLDASKDEAFALLAFDKMGQPQGDAFVVDGTTYVAKLNGQSIEFHRADGTVSPP
jgi:hypothetical protein